MLTRFKFYSDNMDACLLKILICPICNIKLSYVSKKQEFFCKKDNVAFPLKDGIPVLLINEARNLTSEEINL